MGRIELWSALNAVASEAFILRVGPSPLAKARDAVRAIQKEGTSHRFTGMLLSGKRVILL